ncbi:unnamed protein product [Bathycoccus prasinos]
MMMTTMEREHEHEREQQKERNSNPSGLWGGGGFRKSSSSGGSSSSSRFKSERFDSQKSVPKIDDDEDGRKVVPNEEEDKEEEDKEREEDKEEEKTQQQQSRLFVPDEEKARSQKRDWQDGIAGRSNESGYQNVERRKVLEPPRKNHGIFPGARLPRDEPFFEEEEKVSSSSSSSSSTIKRLDRLPQYMSEIERFRKIDLAEEQKREAKRFAPNATNEITRDRTYVGNRPNKSGCGWDPVNMKLNEARVRKEDLKEEERMRMKREMVEKRTHSESFDIVTHLEKRGMSSCAAFAKEKTTTTREVSPVKTGGAENFNDFVGI